MKTKLLLSGVLMLTIILSVSAATHIIEFGGTHGLAYSPNTLTAQVGDTIIWEGAFSSHPLESTSVPNGASVFGNGTGTSFMYVIQVAGNYTYNCALHGSGGMTGQFTATAVSTAITETAADLEITVFPAITRDVVQVNLRNDNGSTGSIELFNMQGLTMHEPIPVITNSIQVDLSEFPSGVYFIVFRNEKSAIAVRKVEKK